LTDIFRDFPEITNVYPKVSGLAAWSENYKWRSSLPLRESGIAIL
jgi:hypothetical protein